MAWTVGAILVLVLLIYTILELYSGRKESMVKAPLPGTRVLRSWYTNVAGVSKKNSDGTRRQEIIADCDEGEELLLIREPDNRYDPNAIKVCRLLGDQIGYIPGDVAARLADEIDEGKKFSARISDLTGGVKGKRTRGVNIRISVHE